MTPQQLAVLDFIRNRLEETGVAPTYDEIMRRGWSAASKPAQPWRAWNDLRRAGELIQAW
jgi:SOS-response transcriptional repressor LexA